MENLTPNPNYMHIVHMYRIRGTIRGRGAN